MTERNDGGPAFPAIDTQPHWHGDNASMGMSLRDYFAAVALTGLLAANKERHIYGDEDEFCEKAYRLADAMLRERAK